MFNKSLVVAVFSFFFSSSVLASGGYSGGDSYGSGSYGTSKPAKKVDHAYENGKAIYKGRVKGKSVSYCITAANKGNASVAVKRRTIKQLKGATYSDVGERLHNCENPKETMKVLLTQYQLNSVAYYLNKRYKLNLARS